MAKPKTQKKKRSDKEVQKVVNQALRKKGVKKAFRKAVKKVSKDKAVRKAAYQVLEGRGKSSASASSDARPTKATVLAEEES